MESVYLTRNSEGMMKIMGPAGGREAFDAALAAGADEIYMGLRGYGARRSAANFSPDEFCRAIDDAHRFDVAINLTLNTVMAEGEVEEVAPDLNRLYAAGLDAVIVQDFGVADWLRSNFPELSVHASTQMALANRTEVAWAEKNGFSRVVLPRELSFGEIAAIRAGTNVELEVFASGALCLACSGKCYLSSFIGGRSGNRGSCAQPCRQRYEVETAADGEGKEADAIDKIDCRNGYLLSLTDQLQETEEVSRLAEIGVGVLKIEGRMKSPAYVYEAVRYYRQLIDRLRGIIPEWSQKMFALKGDQDVRPLVTHPETSLPKIFNRGYGKGFLVDHDPAIRHPEFASTFGVKIGRVENGVIWLTDSIRHGDGIVYVDDHFEKLGGGNVSRIERLSKRSGERPLRVVEASAGDRILLDEPPPENAKFLYRSFDFAVNKEILHAVENVQRHEPVVVRLIARISSPLTIELVAGLVSASASSDAPLEKSMKRKTTAADLESSLSRFGETPFIPEEFVLQFDEDVFLPKSVLNQVRQKAAEALKKAMIEEKRRTPVEIRRFAPPMSDEAISSNVGTVGLATEPVWAANVRTDAQARAAADAGIATIYRLVRPVLFEDDRIAWEESAGEIGRDISPGVVFGALAGNLAEAEWFEKRAIPFAADLFFNIGNARSAKFLLDRFSFLRTLYLSPELAESTVTRLAKWIAPRLAERQGRVGLSVYGRLPGMTTRKTLFDADRVEMTNQDGRRFWVMKTRNWFSDAKGVAGSVVYYVPNDVTQAVRRLTSGGFGEFRLDFTDETPEEVTRIIQRVQSGEAGDDSSPNAYGFAKPIF